MPERAFYVLRISPADEPHLLAARAPYGGAEAFIPGWGFARMPRLSRYLDDPDRSAPVDAELAEQLMRAGFGPSVSLAELAVMQIRGVDEIVVEPVP